jgi:hypothetical protein
MPKYLRNSRTRYKPKKRRAIFSILDIQFSDGSILTYTER